jgi:hypothetical protein
MFAREEQRHSPESSPRRGQLLLSVWAVWLALLVPALAAAPASPQTSKRFLFVVDVSASMGRLAEPLHRTLFQLIETGVEGRMQPGDTFGLWTCNDRLSVDYPMQVWDNAERLVLAYRAMEHLKNLRLAKPSRLQVALSGVSNVLNSVKDLTVVILTDPANELAGTPFDKEIQGALSKVSAESRQDKKPAVVALLAEGGRMVKWSVSSQEAMVSLPMTAASSRPAPTMAMAGPTNLPQATNTVTAKSTVPPPPSTTNDPSPPPPVVVTTTNSVPPTKATSALAESNAAVAVATNAAPIPAATNIAPSPVASQAVSPDTTNTNSTPLVHVAVPTPAEEKPATTAPTRRAPIILTRDSQSLREWAQVPASTNTTVETNPPPPVLPSNPPPTVAAAVSNPPPLVVATNVDAVKAATGAPPVTAQTQVPPGPVLSNAASLEPSSNPPPRAALPIPPFPPGMNNRVLVPLGIAGGCAGAVILAGFLWWRLRASRPQPSLITRSVTRNRE